MKTLLLFPTLLLTTAALAQSLADNRAHVAGGDLLGSTLASGIHRFAGVPYAAPPVGELRWREPQPAASWAAPRQATAFGPRAMQLPVFGDMNFRSAGVSEDCLYLNVWTGAAAAGEKRPVLVYFYGGGFIAGDGSEPRYDGEALARRGIVTVTVNYRLGVFGFLAHPALTQELGHHASGNYGLLDQAAALRWVQANIAAFGGDPARVTIGGESAGSFSVSAQLASPLSKELVAGAIGESGSLLGRPLPTLAEGEQTGTTFAASLGASSLAALRALPAQQLLEAAGKPDAPRFGAVVDGYFLTEQPAATYAAGRQAHVPLLVGWNSLEMNAGFLLGQDAPTLASYRAVVQKLYGDHAAPVLAAYPAATDAEAATALDALASDRFIAYGTWLWADAQARTSSRPVYRYLFARPRPAMRPEVGNATAGLAGGVVKGDPAALPAPPAKGAVHSAEIEYALGNLGTNKVYAWLGSDYRVSDQFQAYLASFVRTGNPNGAGLPTWQPLNADGTGPTLRIDVQTQLLPEAGRARYELLRELAAGK